MTRFDFRLEPLLEHKRQQEEQKMLELASLTAEERTARAALDELRSEERSHLQTLEAIARQGAIDPTRHQAATCYLEQLDRAIRQQSDVLDDVVAQVDERRLELLGVLKEKRSLERLRERQAEEAALDEARRQARRDDDQTASRHVRRTAAGRGTEGGA